MFHINDTEMINSTKLDAENMITATKIILLQILDDNSSKGPE